MTLVWILSTLLAMHVSGENCPIINSCDSNYGVCAFENGQEICSCLDGFVLDDDYVTCIDVDECELGTHGCEQGCTNTIGGADCYCFEGYEILNPRLSHLCKDINECDTDNGGCDHTCTNEEGSFVCSCDDGYDLFDGWACAESCDK
uniref:Multiple epidermal growth factor-like domains protein 6-like isoform X2 n=1 Tax=Saccoglossus kowalevskii TaxID=10224 RepID=A0ABM0M4E1_SACKO|nr:PREDICTED: multiple epidermal growth factor-like domains protein 6-like isoform X2 [Saccoglossus kowalevskii]